MKPKHLSKLSILFLFAAQINAATIDWTAADISDVSEVETTGTLVTAQNYAGTGAPSTIVVAGISFSENNNLSSQNANGDFFGLETGDAAYNEFLGDIDFTANNTPSVTIPLAVSNGSSYLLQVWYADDGAFNATPSRTMTFAGTGDNILEGNQYAVGTFVADSNSQNLVITSNRQGVRLTGYQLREVPTPPSGPIAVIADAGADYVNGNTFPSGWQYLQSNSENGGSQEELLAAGQTVGQTGNTGFGGDGSLGSASLLGSIQGGSQFGLYSGAGHNGVQAVDLLIQPGNSSSDSFIIARYNVSTADLNGGSVFSITGSFRDEQGGTDNNDSVEVFVFQNNTPLFAATGANGRLFEPDGTFNLTGITLNDGDIIDFVVGRRNSFGGDETALRATITRTSVEGAVDDAFNVVTSSTTDLDILSNDGEDLDSTTVQVTVPPTEGTATVQTDGTVEYVHGGTIGNDSFTYSVADSSGTVFSAEVTVVANNGNKTSYGNSLAFPSEVPSGGFSFPDAFAGITFSQPTCMEHFPGDPTKLIVTERSGRIYLVNDIDTDTPSRQLFLTIPNVRTSTFAGLRGVAFHPDFANNRYLYVGYDSQNAFGGTPDSIRISRFTANANNLNTVNPATEVVLHQARTGDGRGQGIHRINRLQFGPDGYLYIAVGDDGNFTGPPHTQRIDDDIWSSVLRIDVDKQPGNFEPANLDGVTLDSSGQAFYSIPADNPYVDQNFSDGRGVSSFNGQPLPTGDPFEVRTEMYCVGFRNPWKIGFVPDTGELWVADDGAAGYEKVSASCQQEAMRAGVISREQTQEFSRLEAVNIVDP